MPQSRRPVQLPLISFISLCMLVVLTFLLWRRFMKPESEPSVTRHSVENSPDDALKYWTADKMHNTSATNMPTVNELHEVKPRRRRFPRLFRSRRSK